MENLDQNQSINQNPVETGTDNMQAYVQENRKKRNKILVGIFASLFVVVIAVFAYMNPNFFRASLVDEGTTPIDADTLYIPDYDGGAGDSGTIAVKTKDEISQLDSITFTLTYDPVDSLIFDSDPVVFDSDTVFQGAAFSMANDNGSGELTVTVIFDSAEEIINTVPDYCSDHDGDQVSCEAAGCTYTSLTNFCDASGSDFSINPSVTHTHPTLFKLETQIDSGVASGQHIDLGVQDLAVLNGTTEITTATMVAGEITVEGQNELQVLNAEALDSTHVLVNFSDYLSTYDSNTFYDITCNIAGVLNVANVELGDIHGYSQQSVVLTTDAQTASDLCVLTALSGPSGIMGNTQGEIDDNYDSAIFFGYGQATGELSDFGMESAEVPTSSYNQVTITFTEDVQSASVIKEDFQIENITNPADSVAIGSVDNVSGNEVTLNITNGYLLKQNTYLITAIGSISSITSDPLGIDKVAFSGSKNGPRITNYGTISVAEDTGAYSIQVSFDEDIEESGTFTNYGRLFDTGLDSLVATVNDHDCSVNVDELTCDADAQCLWDAVGTTCNPKLETTISGTTMTITDTNGTYFNDPDKNFTFVIAPSTNIVNTTDDVPVDNSYNSITFWGYGHTSTETVGSASVTDKDVVTVNEGTYDFADIVYTDDANPDNDNILVFWYNDSASLVIEDISSVSIVSGDLEIVFDDPLVPNRHYILSIEENVGDTNPIITKEFVVNQSLEVTDAEAASDTEVCISFSNNIDEDTIVTANFEVYEDSLSALGVTSYAIQPDYQSVCLDVSSTLDAGTVYYVNSGEGNYIYGYQDGNALENSVAVFGGYGTASSGSEVVVSSVDVNSSTSVTVNFSDDIDASTVTPINVDLKYSPFGVSDMLTITNVTQLDSNSFELTTNTQDSGVNYFVVMDGVKDSTGLLLGNASVINFFGFTIPEVTVTDIDPNVVNNDVDTVVTLEGQNLDTVVTLKLGNTEMTIDSSTATTLEFTVPIDFTEDVYDMTLIDSSAGTKTLTNAVTVSGPASATEMQVVSEESLAVPYNVPNDGTTTTTLWVLVQDPIGLNNIEYVIVDLSDIGGPSTQEMNEDTGTQPEDSQWYTYEVTIPSTVSTSNDPYELPIEVHKGAEVATGTVSLMVTNDVYQSVAPVIDQLYISPLSLPPDGETEVKISAQITDTDGVDTLTSITADLGALGAGFVSLSPLTDTAVGGGELTTAYYESDEFTVPTTTPQGTYSISVTASDNTGETGTQTVSITVSDELTGPSIDSNTSYISPRQSVPNDDSTLFSIYAYVSDPDGVSDITTVSASFDTLGISPQTLLKDPDTSTEATSAWYSVENLTVPVTSPIGVHQIEVIASDSTGGSANLIIQIDVTNEDTLGDAPVISDDRNYTTPTVAINDGETPVTLYAFIRDDDNDLETVYVNLASIGQVGTSDLGSSDDTSSDDPCASGSNTLVCMNASVSEGDEGQWFVLPDVTINESTSPSSDPYEIQVVAIDSMGKTSYGTIPLYINDGDSYTNDAAAPEVVLATATSSTTVEVLFSEEISSNTISSNGSEFTITDKTNTSSTLSISSATINAAGTTVTLTTAEQSEDKEYALFGSSDIKDAVGVALVAGSGSTVYFDGFTELGSPPSVEYIGAADTDLVEIEFSNDLLPSSVTTGSLDGSQSNQTFNIEITESGGSTKLDILGVEFNDAGNKLLVKTSAHKSGQRYRARIFDLASYDGTYQTVSINEQFEAVDLQVVQDFQTANAGDLNGDGVVDFIDFTMFSAIYGTSYINSTNDVDNAPESVGGPIEDDPDATVPITSEPAGGDVE